MERLTEGQQPPVTDTQIMALYAALAATLNALNAAGEDIRPAVGFSYTGLVGSVGSVDLRPGNIWQPHKHEKKGK